MWIQDYEQRESTELMWDDFLFGQRQQPLSQNELFTITMRGKSKVGIPSVLEDSYFSLENLTRKLEDILQSETKEYLGIRFEAIQDLDSSERHKVIEITNC